MISYRLVQFQRKLAARDANAISILRDRSARDRLTCPQIRQLSRFRSGSGGGWPREPALVMTMMTLASSASSSKGSVHGQQPAGAPLEAATGDFCNRLASDCCRSSRVDAADVAETGAW